jgi:hypothetical protein
MPSDKPRITLYLDKQDMEWLGLWANQEFLTVPQLTRVVVKRAIAEYLKQNPSNPPAPNLDRTNDSPTENTPSPDTKAKRGKASKEAS